MYGGQGLYYQGANHQPVLGATVTNNNPGIMSGQQTVSTMMVNPATSGTEVSYYKLLQQLQKQQVKITELEQQQKLAQLFSQPLGSQNQALQGTQDLGEAKLGKQVQLPLKYQASDLCTTSESPAQSAAIHPRLSVNSGVVNSAPKSTEQLAAYQCNQIPVSSLIQQADDKTKPASQLHFTTGLPSSVHNSDSQPLTLPAGFSSLVPPPVIPQLDPHSGRTLSSYSSQMKTSDQNTLNAQNFHSNSVTHIKTGGQNEKLLSDHYTSVNSHTYTEQLPLMSHKVNYDAIPNLVSVAATNNISLATTTGATGSSSIDYNLYPSKFMHFLGLPGCEKSPSEETEDVASEYSDISATSHSNSKTDEDSIAEPESKSQFRSERVQNANCNNCNTLSTSTVTSTHNQYLRLGKYVKIPLPVEVDLSKPPPLLPNINQSEAATTVPTMVPPVSQPPPNISHPHTGRNFPVKYSGIEKSHTTKGAAWSKSIVDAVKPASSSLKFTNPTNSSKNNLKFKTFGGASGTKPVEKTNMSNILYGLFFKAIERQGLTNDELAELTSCIDIKNNTPECLRLIKIGMSKIEPQYFRSFIACKKASLAEESGEKVSPASGKVTDGGCSKPYNTTAPLQLSAAPGQDSSKPLNKKDLGKAPLVSSAGKSTLYKNQLSQASSVSMATQPQGGPWTPSSTVLSEPTTYKHLYYNRTKLPSQNFTPHTANSLAVNQTMENPSLTRMSTSKVVTSVLGHMSSHGNKPSFSKPLDSLPKTTSKTSRFENISTNSQYSLTKSGFSQSAMINNPSPVLDQPWRNRTESAETYTTNSRNRIITHAVVSSTTPHPVLTTARQTGDSMNSFIKCPKPVVTSSSKSPEVVLTGSRKHSYPNESNHKRHSSPTSPKRKYSPKFSSSHSSKKDPSYRRYHYDRHHSKDNRRKDSRNDVVHDSDARRRHTSNERNKYHSTPKPYKLENLKYHQDHLHPDLEKPPTLGETNSLQPPLYYTDTNTEPVPDDDSIYIIDSEIDQPGVVIPMPAVMPVPSMNSSVYDATIAYETNHPAVCMNLTPVSSDLVPDISSLQTFQKHPELSVPLSSGDEVLIQFFYQMMQMGPDILQNIANGTVSEETMGQVFLQLDNDVLKSLPADPLQQSEFLHKLRMMVQLQTVIGQ